MRSAALVLAALALGGCADLNVHAVPGMPGVTVRAVGEPARDPGSFTNEYGHLVTIYYADGRMQAVGPGETVGIHPGVSHTVQVENPRKLRKKNG